MQLNNYLPTQSIPANYSPADSGGGPIEKDEIDRAAIIIAYAMANLCKSSL